MQFKEKCGGLWSDDFVLSGWQVVFESYDPTTDLIAVVFQKEDLFKSVLFEKIADPQWALPVWSEIRPDSLFDNHDEGKQYGTSSNYLKINIKSV